MKTISDNFELRFVSHDPQTNGETDFKGETSTLNTEQRVAFLEEYARSMEEFYPDLSLDKPVVSLETAREQLNAIKPQPQPSVRRRVDLADWKWIGYNEKAKGSRLNRMERSISMEVQDWRCFVELELLENQALQEQVFSLGGAATVGFDAEQKLYYLSDGETHFPAFAQPLRTLKWELDFVNRRWNLFLNGTLCADFVPFSEPDCCSVAQIAAPFCLVKKIWGVGYHPLTENLFEPYCIHTFLDEDFSQPLDMDGWNQAGYDDAAWNCGTLPIAHGGERFAGQDLFLRKEILVEDLPAYAEWYIESLTPGGEVFVNGRPVALIRDPIGHKIDVTDYLVEGSNLLSVRVYANKIKDSNKMTHTSTDLYTGWFAGRMHLDLLPCIYLDDVFIWTEHIENGLATQHLRVAVKSIRGMASALAVPYTVCVKAMKWFPQEGAVCAQKQWQTPSNPNITETTEANLEITAPELWTAGAPNLYKFLIELIGPDGRVCDDIPVIAGIRTVSQEGGTFRINGQPELLRAPLLFGARPPLDKIATWEKCPPAEYYVQEMLMTKGMNANGLRLSIHDERMGGINDPRICELADQLGIMLVWQTTTWLRITAATNINLFELSECIRQVRNHCSIVIWQPANHPSWKDWDTVMRVYRNLHDTICALDPSRLISPSADYRRMKVPRHDDGLTDFTGAPCTSCDPAWTADGICRGNMDYILGYGNEWSALREWPYVKKEHLPLYMDSTGYIPSMLQSPARAYFNFEHDEIIGQPNWNVLKGKPMYQVKSYERAYDEGSIGRELTFEEWKTSQAWQAFGAYETIRKCRWLDYDGLCWCNLRGGQNTVTYQKCLIDYYGQAKLAYYAHRMAFQDVLACSGNVDTVYGPGDTVPVSVLNIGEEKQVNVLVQVTAQDGTAVWKTEYSDISLPAGRTVSPLTPFTLPDLTDGLYQIRYTVLR